MRNPVRNSSATRLHLIFAHLLFIPLFIGCGGSDDPAAPQEPTWSTVMEETIGVGGGTLTGDGFNLIIPAGAFTTEATVVVSTASAGDHPLLDSRLGSTTDVYRFSGLPEFTTSLTIELPFDPVAFKSEESFIVYFEEDVFLDDEPDPVPAGWPLADTVVDGTAGVIRATIPPHVYADQIDPQQKFSTDIDFVVTRAQHNLLYASNDDFTVRWMAGEVDQAWIDGLLADLATAKAKLEGMGYELHRLSSIRVEAIPIPGSDGNFIQSKFGLEFSQLQIDPSLQGDERLVSAGHELFHLFQQGYGNCGHYFGYSHRWLSEACSIWFEPVLLVNPSYVADIQNVNANFMSKGLEANTADVGYGAGAFLTWLTDKYDQDLVLEINRKVAENSDIPGAGVHAVNEALLDRGSYLNFEFRQFARDFAIGRTGHSGWNTPPTESGILTKTRTKKDFRIQAMDLSAHPILAAIDLNTWPTNPSPPHFLVIEMGGSTPSYVEAFVFQSSTMTGPWGAAGVAESGKSVMIPGFGTGFQNKVKVVLINSKGDIPCTGKEGATVTLRLATCEETVITGHNDVYLMAHVMVRYGGAPADSIPVTVNYNKVHCDGHLGSVGPVSGYTRSDGVYNAQTMAGFSVYNGQELFRASATVNGVTLEKVYTLAEMERTFFFEPKIADIIFEFCWVEDHWEICK